MRFHFDIFIQISYFSVNFFISVFEGRKKNNLSACVSKIRRKFITTFFDWKQKNYDEILIEN